MDEPSGLSLEQIDLAVEMIGADGVERVFPVAGDSMRPTLAPGDALLVDLGDRRPRGGDIVLFRSTDRIVVHRFLRHVRSRRRGAHLRFRGDGRPSFDPPVAPTDVRGIVRAVRRDGTWWGVDTGTSRLWARAVAWHDRFWGLVFAAAVHAFGRDRAVPWAVARLDAALLRRADRIAFRRLHRRRPEPPSGDGDEAVALL